MQACERTCCYAATIPKAASAGMDPPFGACADELYMWGRLGADAWCTVEKCGQQHGLHRLVCGRLGLGQGLRGCDG